MRASKRRVQPCAVPTGSAIERLLAGASFHDAWTVNIDDPSLPAFDHFIATIGSTPRWVDAMMLLRNRIVSIAGLKNLGEPGQRRLHKARAPLEAGDRVGIFTLISHSPDEVLVGDDDKHLRVVLSLVRRQANDTSPACVVLTTVVHVHNWLGRLYMLPVAPMHKLIAPAVMRRTAT